MHRNLAIVALLLTTLAWASVAPASPIVGTSANTIPQGTFMLDTWFKWESYTRSFDTGSEVWIDLPDSSKMSKMTLSPRLYYGVTDWLTMRVAFPFVHKFEQLRPEDAEDSNIGPGDLLGRTGGDIQ